MAASEYAPGTVAVATVRGMPGLRVMRVNALHTSAKWCVVSTETPCLVVDRDVTDVRPLVVLDPEADDWPFVAKDAKGLRAYAEQAGSRFFAVQLLIEQVADQIETKPPRIPEPGLWGVVEAATDGVDTPETWVQTDQRFWYAPSLDAARKWDDLIDPTLIREGVES